MPLVRPLTIASSSGDGHVRDKRTVRRGESEEGLACAAVKEIDAELGVGRRQRLHHRELDIENMGERRPVGLGGQNAVRDAHLAHRLREQGVDVPHILAVERFLGEIIENRVILARQGRLKASEKDGVIRRLAGDLFLDGPAGEGERLGAGGSGGGGARRLGALRFRRLPSGIEEKGHRQCNGDHVPRSSEAPDAERPGRRARARELDPLRRDTRRTIQGYSSLGGTR